jgi:hypothetical protein
VSGLDKPRRRRSLAVLIPKFLRRRQPIDRYHRPGLSSRRRDLVVVLLAVAGVVGAISLAGIFVVYLVDTIGDDDGGKPTAQNVGTSGARGPSGPTGGTTGGTPGRGPTLGGGVGGAPAGNPGALNVLPRNQKFVTFTNRSAGYSILYPKGWNKQGQGDDLKFVHNNDFVRIAVKQGQVPSVADMKASLRTNPSVRLVKSPANPGRTTVDGHPSVHATVVQKSILQNTPQGAIRLAIDFYRVPTSGKFATIDLATPDRVRAKNLDEYNKIINSFHWL